MSLPNSRRINQSRYVCKPWRIKPSRPIWRKKIVDSWKFLNKDR